MGLGCLYDEPLGFDAASLWTKVWVNFKFGQIILFLCERAVVRIFDNQESLLQWWYIQWTQLCPPHTPALLLHMQLWWAECFEHIHESHLVQDFESPGTDICLGLNQIQYNTELLYSDSLPSVKCRRKQWDMEIHCCLSPLPGKKHKFQPGAGRK